jgi:transposase InsO family protein
MMLASESGIPIARACDVLGVSRATHYRTSSPRPEARSAGPRRPSPRRLSDIERAALLDVLHSPEFVDQPPAEIYASLLSRGEYLGSVRTMYRLLAEHGETQERRRQRRPHQHPIPTLSATAPNQVWTWDITKLRGPAPGIFYALYVIIDLFSRMVVGWLLAGKESGELAKQLFAEAYARHDVKPGSLVVHSDRGAAMRSEGLAQLFGKLGVERSFSRPRVSDDNAFSEAHFKTLKYQPDYPDRFSSDLHARGWGEEFFGWYNERHHHVGLALFTPAEVFYGRVDEIIVTRQRTLDAAYAAHPHRFPNGRPIARRPPSIVEINPLLPAGDAAQDVSEQQRAQLAAPASGVRLDATGCAHDTEARPDDTPAQARTPDDGAEPRGPITKRSAPAPRRAEPRQPRTLKRSPSLRPVPS